LDQGSNGTAEITQGGVTYTHDGSDTNTDTFTYTVIDGNGGTATGTVTVTIAAAAGTTVPESNEIAFGGTRSGVITSGGVEEWTFEGTAGQVVTINMYATSGSGLDTYLILNNPSGAVEERNDDGGTGVNSRIERALAETGTYTIESRGYNGRPGFSTGAYEITLVEGTPAAPVVAGAASNLAGEIAFGATGSGVITSGGSDGWTFEGTAGQAVTINMYATSGSGLDTYLILNSPSGLEEVYNDDGGAGLNSRILRQLSETGTYTIVARGYNGRPGFSTGAYEITLEEE
jgi:hypothetical protein